MNGLQQRRCSARWPTPQKLQVLAAAVLAALSLSAAGARQLEPQSSGTRTPSSEAQSADQPNSAEELPPPIVIEGEELRPDDSMRQFRDALRRPDGASERRLADGTVELVTRFGRFCVKPLPSSLQPQIGGEVTLAARCTSL